MSLRKGGGSFDIDFPHGMGGEDLSRELGYSIRTVEVKREDNAREWGSLYVETEHDPGPRGLYVPSGLSISDAEYWAFVIGAFVLYLPTSYLRQQRRHCRGGEQPDGSCPTRGFRLRFSQIFAKDRPDATA